MTSTKAGSFVVLSTQRSGSTWFVDVMNTNPKVVAEEELFLPRRAAARSLHIGSNYERFQESNASFRPIGTWRFLNTFFAQPGCVGFKLMYSQLRRFPEIWPLLVSRRIPVIHLVRENLVDVVISGAIVASTDRAHYLVGESRPVDVSVTLNPASVIGQLTKLASRQRQARRMLSVSLQPHIEVTYEQLVENPDLFRDSFQFLGVHMDGFQPMSRFQRVRVSTQSAAVRNWSEVVSAIQDSEFAEYLT